MGNNKYSKSLIDIVYPLVFIASKSSFKYEQLRTNIDLFNIDQFNIELFNIDLFNINLFNIDLFNIDLF